MPNSMKLKIWHRLTLLIGALLLIIIGAAILIGSLQFNEIPIRTEGEGFFTITRLILLFGGALTVLFGIFTLTLPGKMKLNKDSFVIQKTESGEMRISVQAIESIIQKCLAQHDEIKMQSLQVINAKGGVSIEMKTSLANNINIPLAVNSLQKHIRQHLNATSGVDAKDIRIIIENADAAVKDSPFLVKPAELVLKTGDIPEVDKKPNQGKA